MLLREGAVSHPGTELPPPACDRDSILQEGLPRHEGSCLQFVLQTWES